MIPPSRFLSRSTPICCVLVLIALAAPLRAELVADFAMFKDPEFQPLPRVKEFPRDFQGVWRQALERPEADYQRLAAETVARAHEHGIPDLIRLAPVLERILTEPASHPAARFAAARALIVLASRDSAPKLLEAGLQHGADLRQLVEPALAGWDFGPARAVWTERLKTPRPYSRDLVLALRCLGTVRETAALRAIVDIASDPLRPQYLRLEAAQAAGEISESGLEDEAERLAHDRRSNPLVNRLCAVRFLGRHTSEAARRVLIGLAGDAEPSLAAAALQRLNDIDPELVVPLAAQALTSADPRVRQAGAKAWLLRPAPERIAPLARLLDDDHPAVRQQAGEGLYRLAADPQWEELVRAESMKVLAGDRWQGQVQATLVLGMLEYKPAAGRFVELLESERPDVMTHAAWGLRKLADPSTIPAILDKLGRQIRDRQVRHIPGVDEQVAHLFEACGRMHVVEAEPLMIPYVPKDLTRTMDLSRCAAIWALGHLHAGQPDGPLGNALISRVLDEGIKPLESPQVKQMAAVALARMKAIQHAGALKGSLAIHARASALDLATRWAVHELTGEEIPPPVPLNYPEGTWFLEPLDPKPGSQP